MEVQDLNMIETCLLNVMEKEKVFTSSVSEYNYSLDQDVNNLSISEIQKEFYLNEDGDLLYFVDDSRFEYMSNGVVEFIIEKRIYLDKDALCTKGRWYKVTNAWITIEGEYSMLEGESDVVFAKRGYFGPDGRLQNSKWEEVRGKWGLEDHEVGILNGVMDTVRSLYGLRDDNKVLILTEWNDHFGDSDHVIFYTDNTEAGMTKTTSRRSDGMFCLQTANQWMEQSKLTSIPSRLFSELWHENEICILFADTNVGKSILAVQIGDSVSRGVPVEGFSLDADRQPVLYFDFELTAKQFEARYSIKNDDVKVYTNHYIFDKRLIRVEINNDAEFPDDISFEKYLSDSMEDSILRTGSKVVIIDNLTFIKSDNERAKDASLLMKYLKGLKNKHGLSILVLAHTPKINPANPLSKNDIAGSKMLINFCDSCFAIGNSQKSSNTRYIKQIKARNTEVLYGDENVIECVIQKQSNFLGFQVVGYGHELEHLKKVSVNEKQLRRIEARDMKENGMSNVEIGEYFGVTEGAVRKWLKIPEE